MANVKISNLTAATTPVAGTEVLPIVQSGATVKVSIANLTAGRSVSATGLALAGSTSGTVTLAAKAVAGSTTFRLPAADGTSNQAMVTDGSGNLSFATIAATPGGSTTQVQYNNAGAFGGISGVTTDGTRMTASTTIGVGAATPSTSGAGITFPATQSASTDVNTLDDYEEGSWTPGISFGNATTGITYNASTAGFYRKVGSLVMLTGYVQLSNKGSSTGTARVTGLPFTSNGGTGEQGDFGFSLGYTANLTYTNQLVIYGGGGTACLIITLNSGSTPTTLTDTAFANNTLFVLSASYVSTT